ncbi:hypothetical protein [Entomobacter blattae]|uniref:hypothetical protein n=1 Tax=Entomobacter blattae TaxID=2762277 RepID=UPI00193B373C|nr:hypothetical protein [Entomobacter blattae]
MISFSPTSWPAPEEAREEGVREEEANNKWDEALTILAGIQGLRGRGMILYGFITAFGVCMGLFGGGFQACSGGNGRVFPL